LRSHLGFLHDRSILVEIYLWEGVSDQAWQEAQAGGCAQRLWLELAQHRQADYPADVLPIYQREVESLIQQTNNKAYASAIEFLQNVHQLMVRLDQVAEFTAYCDHLHQTYRTKRNFISLLKKQSW
ncbi:MAG: hypothetical protein VKJ24_14225, partial [Synechococcales bacterium]|nr:hypothetical protein [Synechococcales bacterium]